MSSITIHVLKTSNFIFPAQISYLSTKFVYFTDLSALHKLLTDASNSACSKIYLLFCPLLSLPLWNLQCQLLMSEAWESPSLQWAELINVVEGCSL